MSLEGNVTAFGLSEILQLIAVQQKSGMLSVGNQERSKVLFFKDGTIVSTRDRRTRAKDPVKDYFARYGILTRDELIRITQVSTESKLDLTDVILSEGYVSEEEMNKHFRNHIQEEVHELLTWEQCVYKFIPGNDVIKGIKGLGAFNIEGILMESMRRIDETPLMEKLLPGLDTRISREDTQDDDVELTSNQEAILELLDEQHSLGHLIARARMPKFDVYEALKHLNEKGLVDVTVPDSHAEEASAAGTRGRRGRRPRKNPIPALLALLLFSTSFYWSARSVLPAGQVIETTHGVSTAEKSIARSRAEQQLRWRLESHRAQHGRYPETLTQLRTRRIASEALLKRIERFSFRYHLTGSGDHYTLL